MLRGSLPRRSTGLALILILAGLFGLPAAPFSPRTPPARVARPLLLAALARAEAPDIPLVPLPALPRRRPAPLVRPTSAPSPSAATSTPLPSVTTSPKAPTTSNGKSTHTLRQLYQLAQERYADMDSYQVRLTRREQVKGKNQPEEIILFKFRKEPWSLYFKWLSDSGKGREVIYVKGRYGNKMHTRLAAGDAPFMPAGKRLSLDPDSPLVRSACRHPITYAGIGACIDRFGVLLDAQERGDRRLGAVANLGYQNRPELSQPHEVMEHTIAAGVEADLPHGGKRSLYFDPESHLPMLIVTHNERGDEVEYYRYDRLQFPVKLDDDDFNPDKVWAKPTAEKPQ
jgi:hypothetical protein